MTKFRFLRVLLVLVLVVLLLPRAGRVSSFSQNLPVTGSRRPAQLGQAERSTGQVIVKFKETFERGSARARPQAAAALQAERLSQAAGVDLAFVREMSGGARVFRLPQNAGSLFGIQSAAPDLAALIASLEALPEVEYAEPDSIMTIQMTPNDPDFNKQWHYSVPSAGSYGINLPPAWDITTGSPGTVVAVIDTGVLNHADLSGRLLTGYDFIWDTVLSNDGDGRDADALDPGDWIDPFECGSNASGVPSSWHGTHVAGTIAASSNNNMGVSGVNWNARILPVRVLGKCGGYTSDIVDGMRWAAGLSVTGVPANPIPAQVLNLSLGGFGTCSATYQNAVDDVVAAGRTIVVAAGNSGVNANSFQPANCDGVITVAATNRNGSMSYYSNYGPVVEISAPGGEAASLFDTDGILSTLNSGVQGPAADSYAYYQGTSMAAPHVAGVASLLYALNPALTPTQVLDALVNTATDFPSGSGCSGSACGSGIVNAAAALQSLLQPEPPTCTNLLEDPSFEEYTPNPYWDEDSLVFGTPLCTTDDCGSGPGPRTGDVFGWFGGTEEAEEASLAQTVTIPSGSALLEFYLWIEAAAGGDLADVFTASIDGDPLFITDATQAADYTGYTNVSVNASSYADDGEHTLSFNSSTDGQLVNFFLDDVSLCFAAQQTLGFPIFLPALYR